MDWNAASVWLRVSCPQSGVDTGTLTALFQMLD